MKPAKKPTEEEPEPAPQPEVYQPMAVQPPTDQERIEALELQCKIMRNWINAHNRSHFRVDAL